MILLIWVFSANVSHAETSETLSNDGYLNAQSAVWDLIIEFEKMLKMLKFQPKTDPFKVTDLGAIPT